MALPSGLVQPHQDQHNRAQRLAVIAGGGILLIVMLIHGRGQSTNTQYSATDLQKAQADAAAQQQQTDQQLYGSSDGLGTPSTFADNGASAATLADDVTQGLAGVNSALQNLQTQGTDPALTAAIGTLGTTLTTAIGKMGNGQKANGAAAPGQTVGTAIVLPGGHNPPPAPPGFHDVGVGGGGWIAEPNPPPKPPTVVKSHGPATKPNLAAKTSKTK